MKSLERFVPALVVLGVCGIGVHLSAQDLGGLGVKENLDLPYDSLSDLNTEEEDPPEVVNFYGQNFEGDGFFITVDRSTTMQDRGELQRAKQEISRIVSEFSHKTQFAVVFFDASIKKFPASGRPADANPGMKGAALSWIANMQGGRGSCMMEGIREALQFANLSTSRRRVIVYVGDGGGTCHNQNERTYLQNAVVTITAQNYQRVQVNCVGVIMSGRTMQEGFLKQLAASNGGTYRQIN